MEIDTESLHLALAEKDCFDCIWREKRHYCKLLRSKVCNDLFTADARSSFFHRMCRFEHKKLIKKKLDC